MALNPAFIGRAFTDDQAYEVGREKIREFADAIGDANPLYRDPAAARASGHADVVAPPTFPVILTRSANRRAITDPELGLDYSRVVHGTQSFTIARSVHPGDRIRVTVHIDDIGQAGAHEMIKLRGEVTTEAGERICTAHSTLIVRASR